MKKIILLFSLIVITTTSAFAFDFDFILKDTKNNTKTCRAYDEGYVCENEKPVYIEKFKSLFIPHSMIRDIYIGNNQYKTCNQLMNGDYCKNELPLLDTSFLYSVFIYGNPIIKKKGIIIKSKDGAEKICKVEKNGGYTCGNEEQYFNPILPFGTWKFYKSKSDKQEGKICTGYTNGYVCSDNKPYYIDNFRAYFDFKEVGDGPGIFGKTELPTILLRYGENNPEKEFTGVLMTNDNEFEHYNFNRKLWNGILITNKENKQKICKILDFDEHVQYGYACKGETPVVLKNRPKMTSHKNAKDYYVHRKDILTGKSTLLTCKQKDGYYYCPGESKKSIPPQTPVPKCTRTVEHVYINGKHINVSKEQCGDNIYIRY